MLIQLIFRSSNVTVYMETTFSSVLPVDTDTTTDVSVKMKVEVKSLMKALSSIVIEPRAINFCYSYFTLHDQ